MQINRFKHVLYRYNTPVIKEESYLKLEMDYAMKSINIKEEKYTNFVKTYQNEQYKLLSKIYIDYKNGKNILSRFVAYDIELYSKNTKRLSNILSYNNIQNFTLVRTSNVLKYHLIGNNKIRRYIEKNKNNILNVRLIDIYHLAIPSVHRGIPAEVMKERIYNKHRNNKISISNLKINNEKL